MIIERDDFNKYYLHSVSIRNFKTYRSETLVGPFTLLTGIIGPNGAGKSTVLEAVSFCIGLDLFLDKRIYEYSTLVSV